jgi:hypothetical protein
MTSHETKTSTLVLFVNFVEFLFQTTIKLVYKTL